MWDDLPKKSQVNKALIWTLFFLLIISLAISIYLLFFLNSDNDRTNDQTTNAIFPSGSLTSPSARPSINPSLDISPTASSLTDYKVPDGEKFVISSNADTNGDAKDEVLVITSQTSGKYHAYILSSDGQSLFDNKELLKKPLRIGTQTFDPAKESYLSWMLVFSENSGDLAFIHFNGTQYEIPQNEGI